jgi:hypothetical protein
MKIKGIVRGQTIQLLEAVPDLDGLEVIIELPDLGRTPEQERWERLLTVIGSWNDNLEIERVFAEVDRERHADLGNEINLDNI